MDNTQEYTCLSLCSGCGGLELGLKRAVPNVRTVAYVEVEAFACANLVAKMEAGKLDAAPIWTDIKTFDGKPFRGKVDIITAGYPCQGESYAGKRQGQKDPRWLWPHIEGIIETVQPVWFFGENVRGHLSLGFPTVYRSLRLMGYRVESGLFSAAECGSPHQRCRLFILAHTERSDDFGTSRQISGKDEQQTKKRPKRRIAESCCAGELADTTAQRIQGSEPEGTAPAGRQIDQQSDATIDLADTENTNGRGATEAINTRGGNQEIRGQDLWPSRPGQPQYEWEEPRVVADNNIRQSNAGLESQPREKKIAEFRTNSNQESKGQAKPRLGGAANGTPRRVDRLRLLGNGVVPQQAELAFRELMSLNDFEANR